MRWRKVIQIGEQASPSRSCARRGATDSELSLGSGRGQVARSDVVAHAGTASSTFGRSAGPAPEYTTSPGNIEVDRRR
jgi:hypothetical protein